MRIKRVPAGFIIPAQPVVASRPPSGANWVHEIKHDGYRLMVRRDGERIRCLTRNGHDWADRFPAIVDAALRINATSFLIDGEAIVRRWLSAMTGGRTSMRCAPNEKLQPRQPRWGCSFYGAQS